MQTQQAFHVTPHQAQGYQAQGYQAPGYQASPTVSARVASVPLAEAYRRRLPALLTVLILTAIALVTGATVLAGQSVLTGPAADSASVSQFAATGSTHAASRQR